MLNPDGSKMASRNHDVVSFASAWASQPSGHVWRLKAGISYRMQIREKSWPESTQTHNKII